MKKNKGYINAKIEEEKWLNPEQADRRKNQCYL